MKKQQKFKVKVLRDLCIGAVVCEAIAPKVFQIDDEGRAFVLGQNAKADTNGFIEVTRDSLDNILKAARACPAFAIIVVDDKNKQIFPSVA